MNTSFQLRFCLLLLSCTFSIYQSIAQIRNGYFESWQTYFQSEPLGWKSEGKTEFSIRQGNDSAFRLWNNTNTQTVGSAYFSRDPSDLIPAPGFPVAYTPDSVVISYRCNLNLDTASITIGFTKSGEILPVILENINFDGNSNWVTKTFALEYIGASAGIIADSAFILISSSDPVYGPFSNGSFEVDFIQFKSGTLLQPSFPNFSFQQWSYTSVVYPEYWYTQHMEAIDYLKNGDLTCFSNELFSGSGSLLLQGLSVTSSNGFIDTLPGFAISMKNNLFVLNSESADANNPSFSVSTQYNSLRGQIWANLINDQFTTLVNFFKSDSIVGSAYYVQKSSTSGWQQFSTDINWISGFVGSPDSASVQLILSDSTYEKVNSLNSWVRIDELSLDNYFTSTRSDVQNTINVFPNPVTHSLTIHNPENTNWQATLMGIDHKKVMEFSSNDLVNSQVSFKSLQAGMYILQINTATNNSNFKILYTP